MSVTYKPAPPVEQIGRKLIGKHHTDLADVDVVFVFRSEHAERHGQQVWGKARKVSGLNAFLYHLAAATGAGEQPLQDEDSVEAFFVIEIAEDIWWILTPAQKEALVDHELSHCRTKLNKDEQIVLYVAPHDVEEFASVLGRRGMWRPNIRALLKAAKAGQPALWSELDDVEESVTDNGATPDGDNGAEREPVGASA
jgi:predicted RNA-binding protein YlqC (UPF0109 family)